MGPAYSPYGRRQVFTHGWLAGDVDHDGDVDGDDYTALGGVFPASNVRSDADLDGDGDVDGDDYNTQAAQYGDSVAFLDDPLVTRPSETRLSFRGQHGGVDGIALNAVGFQGLGHDEGLDAIDNRARVYLPPLGRFAQTDPLGYPDGLNTYAAYHVMWGGVDPWGFSADCPCPEELRRKCRTLRRLLRFDSADIRNHLEQLGHYNALASELQETLFETQVALALGEIYFGGRMAASAGKLARFAQQLKHLNNAQRGSRLVGLSARAVDKEAALISVIQGEARKVGLALTRKAAMTIATGIQRADPASHQQRTAGWSRSINEHMASLIRDARRRLEKNNRTYEDLGCYDCE